MKTTPSLPAQPAQPGSLKELESRLKPLTEHLLKRKSLTDDLEKTTALLEQASEREQRNLADPAALDNPRIRAEIAHDRQTRELAPLRIQRIHELLAEQQRDGQQIVQPFVNAAVGHVQQLGRDLFAKVKGHQARIVPEDDLDNAARAATEQLRPWHQVCDLVHGLTQARSPEVAVGYWQPICDLTGVVERFAQPAAESKSA